MSKEITKHKMYMRDPANVMGLVVVYLTPCHVPGIFLSVLVGTVGDHLCPWNASSPLAKKEYDKKYKRWGNLIMDDQLVEEKTDE